MWHRCLHFFWTVCVHCIFTHVSLNKSNKSNILILQTFTSPPSSSLSAYLSHPFYYSLLTLASPTITRDLNLSSVSLVSLHSSYLLILFCSSCTHLASTLPSSHSATIDPPCFHSLIPVTYPCPPLLSRPTTSFFPFAHTFSSCLPFPPYAHLALPPPVRLYFFARSLLF